MSLLKELIERGILESKEEISALEREIKESGEKEEEIILKKGILPETVLFDIKSKKLKIPLKEIETDKVLLETLELIPEETAKHYQMIPIEKTDQFLEVGMVYPEDLKAQEALKFFARQGNFNYKVFLIIPSAFKNLLKQYKSLKKEVGKALEELAGELEEKVSLKELSSAATKFEQMAEEAPITKIVAVILRHATEGGASDIHIEPTKDQLRVRFRFLGVLHSSIFLPLTVHLAVVARIKIISV